MNNYQKINYLALFISLIAFNISCGGQAYNNSQTPLKTPTPSGTGSILPPSGGVPTLIPGSSNNSNSSSSSSSSSNSSSPAITKSFTLQGTRGYNNNYVFTPNYSSSVTFSNISSDSRLVINLAPNSGSSSTSGSAVIQAQLLGGSTNYTGCTIYSDCVQIKVQVYDHTTHTQIGGDQYLSANLTSKDGSGSCGSKTAGPSYDFSGQALSSGHGTIDITVSQISSDVYYNSCSTGYLNGHDLSLLYYTYIQSATLVIHTDTTQ